MTANMVSKRNKEKKDTLWSKYFGKRKRKQKERIKGLANFLGL